MEEKDTLTERIIACCYKVHNELGPGFKESIYQKALGLEFKQQGLNFEIEKRFEVYYQDKKVGDLIVDLVVENKVIVELKAINGNFPDAFKYQVISYLKAAEMKVGLLVNFGNKSCQIKRLSM